MILSLSSLVINEGVFQMNLVRTFGAAALLSLASVASIAPASAQWVKEQANVPAGPDGQRVIDLLAKGKHLETVSCHDFGQLDESFRPQAIVYAANYGPKGKAHPTVTIDGVEKIVPVVVDQCKARAGNHFLAAVQTALKLEPPVAKR